MSNIRLVVLATLLGLGTGVAAAAEAPSGPVTVTNFGNKAPVTFDHALHTGEDFACVRCHHVQDQAETRCGACHAASADGSVPSIKDAMHKKDVGVCYGCHLEKGAEQKRKCNDCHRE